jgi:hypothetical protein
MAAVRCDLSLLMIMTDYFSPLALLMYLFFSMPMDHNFKTAYFVIPESVEHGEELVCSYPACRDGGIKFRYCSDCRVPVAK